MKAEPSISSAHNEISPESFAQLNRRQNIGLRSFISKLIQLKEIVKNFTITTVSRYGTLSLKNRCLLTATPSPADCFNQMAKSRCASLLPHPYIWAHGNTNEGSESVTHLLSSGGNPPIHQVLYCRLQGLVVENLSTLLSRLTLIGYKRSQWTNSISFDGVIGATQLFARTFWLGK